MLREVRLHCPAISHWVEFCYSNLVRLYYGEHTLWSCQGVQQGDPIGPLLFALVLHPLICKIRDSFTLSLQAWYLDDGTIVVDTLVMGKVFELILEDGPWYDLHSNVDKTEVFWPKEDPRSRLTGVFPSNIAQPSHGVKLLDGPASVDFDFCSQLVMKRMDKTIELMDAVAKINDPQCELLILRSCTGISMLYFSIHTCSPRVFESAQRSFDVALRSYLEHIVTASGTGFGDWKWRLVTLPFAFGGLGVYYAGDVFVTFRIFRSFSTSSILRVSSKTRSSGKSAQAEEQVHTVEDLEEPAHQEFNIGFTKDQPFDTLDPELLVGPTFELMKGSCKSLVELEYFPEEVYKATTDQLGWNNPDGQQYPHDLRKPLPLIPNSQGRRVIPFDHFINNDLAYLSGGVSSRTYATLVTKTKAADYGHIKWIEGLVPNTIWSQVPIVYDKHALWGISYWGDDDKLYTFKEGDYNRLCLQDIKDMLLLLVQGKLTNLNIEERLALGVSLRMNNGFNVELESIVGGRLYGGDSAAGLRTI
ncbi:uncharacterized mitochondrial protein-like protein [Tanacetum coccineum]